MTKKIIHLIGIAGLIFLTGVVVSAGELDPDFGVDGRVAIEIGTHGDRTQAVAIQSDGKILLGGASTDGDSLSFSLIRLLADGSPDSSFNGDGTVQLDIGSGDEEILALGLTPDGRILAGGYTTSGTDRDFALLRFNADGSLDSGFGNQGKVLTSVGNSDDEVTALVVESNGTVLVAGSAAGTNGRVIVLARYLADGRLDPGFSDHGLSLTGIGRDVVTQGMVVEGDGRIVISGSYTDGAITRLLLVGFTSDGLVDRDFGENGVAAAAYTGKISEGYGIFQATGGDLFVAGSVGAEGERDAALFHFTAEGAPDLSFGENGALISEIGPEDDVLYSLVGDETRLNAGGFTTDNGSRDFLLLSYERKAAEQQVEPAPVSSGARQKTGSLHLGELQVTDSFAAYEFKQVADDVNPLEPTVMTTSFGMGESVSYGLAMQKDGKVVTVGTSGDNGLTSAVVARYKVSDKVAPAAKSDVPFNVNVSTLVPNEIDATGAFSGGNINPGLGAVTQRGVVFSIAPYPVCKTDCASGVADNPGDPGDPGSKAPVVSGGKPTGTVATTSPTLEVTTDVNAICKYGVSKDTAYDAIINTFKNTGGKTHSQELSGLVDGTTYNYYVRCKNTATSVVNGADTPITFKVDTASTTAMNTLNKSSRLLAGATQKIGDFLIPEAQAVDTTTGTTTSTTSTSTYFDTSFIKKEGYTIDGAGSGLYSSILEKLTPDTRYYVRAYAIVNNTVYYGQQYEFETSSACFIATAAYGSILHPAVGVLRDFRDRYLKTNHLGRQVVAWYYKNSPPIADRIAASGGMRFIVRLVLLPVIAVSWMLLHPGIMSMILWIACLTVILFRLRRRCLHTPST